MPAMGDRDRSLVNEASVDDKCGRPSMGRARMQPKLRADVRPLWVAVESATKGIPALDPLRIFVLEIHATVLLRKRPTITSGCKTWATI